MTESIETPRNPEYISESLSSKLASTWSLEAYTPYVLSELADMLYSDTEREFVLKKFMLRQVETILKSDQFKE